MNVRSSNRNNSTWTGMLAVDDTALAVTDTLGPGCPVVYLNGAYADKFHWRRVIAELGSGYRHVTFDERARGKSKRSADYSFEGCVRDLDAVLAARALHRPVLVGWSYGAMVAVHWASRNPDKSLGVVSVDGAYPFDWIDDDAREQIRRLFCRMSVALPIARRFGLAARMTAEQHAEVNIEINELSGTLDPVLDRVTAPVRYVIASGGHLGANPQLMGQVRATLDPVLARKPNIQVSATVASNHTKILRKDFRAVADAIRELAAGHDQEIG